MDPGQQIERKGSSARLHVLLARDAATAVVFRRGPTRQVASYLWDRASDTFSLGQWLIGRIYERRADLSPDGRHLIYFARDARWHSETGGSWTAVSRAPWLRAVTLWAKGDCWQGGGLFVDDQRYWLNGCHRSLLSDDSHLSCVSDPPSGGFGAECLSVYYPRLFRDGWALDEPIRRAGWIDRFQKPLLHDWTLVKLAHRSANPPRGRGCYWDEHLSSARYSFAGTYQCKLACGPLNHQPNDREWHFATLTCAATLDLWVRQRRHPRPLPGSGAALRGCWARYEDWVPVEPANGGMSGRERRTEIDFRLAASAHPREHWGDLRLGLHPRLRLAFRSEGGTPGFLVHHFRRWTGLARWDSGQRTRVATSVRQAPVVVVGEPCDQLDWVGGQHVGTGLLCLVLRTPPSRRPLFATVAPRRERRSHQVRTS